MEIEYCQTKNGLETFKINNIFYHSTYDPEKEAERFVSSISLPYTPAVLFIVEPGFNYCSKYLENKFPNTKIYNIRFINEFVSLNKSLLIVLLISKIPFKFISHPLYHIKYIIFFNVKQYLLSI